jgi:hypothetical protein
MTGCASGATGIAVDEAWARPGNESENTAIYLIITSWDGDDAWISAHTTVAKKTELHRSIKGDDGTMRMEHQDVIELPKDETVELMPGDLHVMLMGLTKDLVPGDEVTLKLVFANHDEIEIHVPVKTP